MAYWLLKSEPTEFSMQDLFALPTQTVPWSGVRNFQARNFMRDCMQLGDLAFFYHSSCAIPGIAGIVKVTRCAYPDPTQFDVNSPYFDCKATLASPRWLNVDVTALCLTSFISLQVLRVQAPLANMRLLAKGNRLSITPVRVGEWQCIKALIQTNTH